MVPLGTLWPIKNGGQARARCPNPARGPKRRPANGVESDGVSILPKIRIGESCHCPLRWANGADHFICLQTWLQLERHHCPLPPYRFTLLHCNKPTCLNTSSRPPLSRTTTGSTQISIVYGYAGKIIVTCGRR